MRETTNKLERQRLNDSLVLWSQFISACTCNTTCVFTQHTNRCAAALIKRLAPWSSVYGFASHILIAPLYRLTYLNYSPAGRTVITMLTIANLHSVTFPTITAGLRTTHCGIIANFSSRSGFEVSYYHPISGCVGAPSLMNA